MLRKKLPNAQMQFLLQGTVHLFQEALPPAVVFGDEICGDTKHIIAWVRENNPKAKILGGRFHKERQPKGDQDCKWAKPTPTKAAPPPLSPGGTRTTNHPAARRPGRPSPR
ncbi:MAG: hypothetical protein R3E79_47345 [Caldilineaceae bacterium]